MKRRLREPRPDDAERVIGVYFLPLFLAFLWMATWWPADRWPVCLLRRWTGLPCPACGTVRALKALARGNGLEAWRLQPLATSLFLLAAMYGLYALISTLLGWRRLRWEHAPRGAGLCVIGIFLLLGILNWLYLLLAGR